MLESLLHNFHDSSVHASPINTLAHVKMFFAVLNLTTRNSQIAHKFIKQKKNGV